MNGRLILIVSLWLKDLNVTEFEAFEREAARNMAKYGGQIERAIGRRKFVYDVWGDAVNVASRMESHGQVALSRSPVPRTS